MFIYWNLSKATIFSRLFIPRLKYGIRYHQIISLHIYEECNADILCEECNADMEQEQKFAGCAIFQCYYIPVF